MKLKLEDTYESIIQGNLSRSGGITNLFRRFMLL